MGNSASCSKKPKAATFIELDGSLRRLDVPVTWDVFRYNYPDCIVCLLEQLYEARVAHAKEVYNIAASLKTFEAGKFYIVIPDTVVRNKHDVPGLLKVAIHRFADEKLTTRAAS